MGRVGGKAAFGRQRALQAGQQGIHRFGHGGDFIGQTAGINRRQVIAIAAGHTGPKPAQGAQHQAHQQPDPAQRQRQQDKQRQAQRHQGFTRNFGAVVQRFGNGDVEFPAKGRVVIQPVGGCLHKAAFGIGREIANIGVMRAQQHPSCIVAHHIGQEFVMFAQGGDQLLGAVILAFEHILNGQWQDALCGFLQGAVKNLVNFTADGGCGNQRGCDPQNRHPQPDRQRQPRLKGGWQPHAAPPNR